MPEKPLLRLPDPKPKNFVPKRSKISETVEFPSKKKQAEYFEPKFERLSQVLDDPRLLENWSHDPASIAPERALVFEVASTSIDFEQASRKVKGLEFLGEDFYSTFPIRDFRNTEDSSKDITINLYFTIPDEKALRELLSLWKIFQTEGEFKTGFKQWEKVFSSLVDIRPWGPKDRLTEDTLDNWKFQLENAPETSMKLEVEFWYRENLVQRAETHNKFKEIIQEVNGQILDKVTISEIQYDATLVELPAEYILEIISDRSVKLAEFSDIMYLKPQSTFSDVITIAEDIKYIDETEDRNHLTAQEERMSDNVELFSNNQDSVTQTSSQLFLSDPVQTYSSDTSSEGDRLEKPLVALLDGLPLANHSRLENRLEVDDPDSYAEKYGRTGYFKHGTSMASAIIHGDLNSKPTNTPISCKLYVRPVMYPTQYGFEEDQTYREQIPNERLILDLIWQCFKRMFQGDDHSDPVAPNVRIVNLSLGNDNRRFYNLISPWARMLDFLVWKYKVLILVSAGNVSDEFPLDDVESVTAFESMSAIDREELVIKGLLKQRATRTLLSPSESVNAITVGARYFDEVIPAGSVGSSVEPFESTFLANPSSALGLGYLRSIKPDILMPGGRERIEYSSNELPLLVSASVRPGGLFGIRTAAPGRSGDTGREMNYSGTSVATGLATHYSVKIMQELNNFPDEPVYPKVPEEYFSILTKTLLVHSTKWDKDLATKIYSISENLGSTHWLHQRDDVSRILGFGAVDTARLTDCSDKRATLIGWGLASSKKPKEYTFPLPSQLKDVSGYRSITITVGWFTPIKNTHRKYWMTKFSVVPNGKKNLPVGLNSSKTQPSHYSSAKGTIFHKHWEGKKTSEFIDDGELKFDLICEPTTGTLDVEIRFGIAATIEVDDEVDIPVYSEVKQRLYQMVEPPIRP